MQCLAARVGHGILGMSLGQKKKRSKAAESTSEAGIELTDLRELEQSRQLAALFSAINSSSVYNMRMEGEQHPLSLN